MEHEAELVTVFRSPDHEAEEEAGRIAALLRKNGLDPVLCDDSAPGVISGTWEVRVPSHQAGQAD